MASYTFDCDQCPHTWTVILPMSQSDQCPPCPSCDGGTGRRVFCPPNVVPDAYRSPILKSCYHSLEGDPYRDPPPFSGRSEERRFRERHQERFGWGGPE